MSHIGNKVNEFYKEIERDTHNRNRSWEHCYTYFQSHESFQEDDKSKLAPLHLGFYLASWGMYRGSSWLLQKDYLIHKYAVGALLKSDYQSLWNLDVDHVSVKEVDLMGQLREDLVETYNSRVKEPVSDTLIRKILLGTMGCVPAFDTFFKIGLRSKGVKYSEEKFKENYRRIIDFYKSKSNEFKRVQQEITNKSKIKYPIMKIIDMYFWMIGREKNS